MLVFFMINFLIFVWPAQICKTNCNYILKIFIMFPKIKKIWPKETLLVSNVTVHSNIIFCLKCIYFTIKHLLERVSVSWIKI